jgi:hypothetical protein
LSNPSFLEYAAERLSDQLRRGEIVQYEYDALMARFRAEAADPTKAPPVPHSSLHLAALGLLAEGADQEEARIAAQHIPSDSARYRDLVAKGRQAAQESADQEAAERYYRTPEGRAELAREHAQGERDRAERVKLARETLSRAAGTGTDHLDDATALQLSGLETDADRAANEERNRRLPKSNLANWKPGGQTVSGTAEDNDLAANLARIERINGRGEQ